MQSGLIPSFSFIPVSLGDRFGESVICQARFRPKAFLAPVAIETRYPAPRASACNP